MVDDGGNAQGAHHVRGVDAVGRVEAKPAVVTVITLRDERKNRNCYMH